MGITGLLPLLSSIQKPCNIKTFRGLTLGVDAYVWLHRAAVASAMDIGQGKPTTKFIAPIMHRVRMLLHFGIIPYIVFDGDYLPSKAITEVSRAKRRSESLKQGNNLLSMGKKAEAHKEFIKAIDITPEMARLLIEELKRNKIQYVVAPYEADAQLAYLERKGIIQGVISEDSDLLVFGIKRLLTKLDEYGDCIEINRADFSALKSIHIAGWTDADFRRMAILSGCDYMSNIGRIGLKTAYQLVRKHQDIERIVKVLSLDAKYSVPADYLAEFYKAELTFLHQRVFCPERRKLVMLTPFEGDEPPEDFDFIGRHVEDEIAQGVAAGELNPNTKEPIKVMFDAENYRPSPNLLRRSKSMQAPIELKAKPISDFFRTSTRKPLAELDPNSFTPSPSQRGVLSRQPSTIISTPVEAVSSRIGTSVASAPAGVGMTRARVTSTSRSKPLFKKQRLCADEGSLVAGEGLRSRFFTPSASDPSPLAKMRGKTKLDETEGLWSDTSLDEALLQLPDDIGDTPSNPRKFKIFTESSGAVEHLPRKNSTASIATLRTENSSESSGIYHSFSKPEEDSQPCYPKLKTHPKMTSSFAEFAKKYTASNYPTPTFKKPLSELPPTTSDTEIVYPTLPRESELEPEVEAEAEAEVEPELPPTFIPESPRQIVKGSEDCIVPCSDIESEVEEALAWEEQQAAAAAVKVNDEIDSPSRRRTLGPWNLARFAFTG